jgi:hypothetical protein
MMISANKDLLDVLIQVLVVVIPIVLSWLLRTYVQNSATQTKIAAISRLASSAIDYAENLDKRGDLVVPENMRKGLYKLSLAGQWMESELAKNGINMSEEDAKKWVASEFQKRMGSDASKVTTLARVTQEAVIMINKLASSNLISIPPDIDRYTYMAGLGADWVVAQMALTGMEITREEAVSWVRAELFKTLQSGGFPSGDRLVDLARQAVAFLDDLRARGQLNVQDSAGAETVELDMATAWVLLEAAKSGLSVSSEQIVQAVKTVLQQQRENKGIVKAS